MDFFWAALRMGWGMGKSSPSPKNYYTYPEMIEFGTIIPYQKKIQKTYESRATPLEFCWSKHFFHRKSADFTISRNTDIDCILMHNF